MIENNESERPQGWGGLERSMPVYTEDRDRERRRRLYSEIAAWVLVLALTAAFLWASAEAWP